MVATYDVALQFLVNETVEQVQWTDNSAARQLVCRQGVGRIRHLSGKLLWVQGLVLEKEISVGQVPTEWIYSDIGTKPLNRTRMLMLLNQIGAIDPITMRMVGHGGTGGVRSSLRKNAVPAEPQEDYKSNLADDCTFGP